MLAVNILVLIFASIAAFDYLLGNKFGLGSEFEKAFKALGTLSLSMIGMIVISPIIANLLSPVFDGVYSLFKIDPSILPAMLFANDMGGAALASVVAKDPEIGSFNALVVSSMMGATISFTIPFATQTVKKENQRELALGLLCGVVTIPIGCFCAGMICGIKIGALMLDLLPLIILSVLIAVCLLLFTSTCVKAFKVLGYFIKAIVVIGLMIGITNALFKKELIPGAATIEEGALICINIAVVMAGMFPIVYIISKLLAKPLRSLEKKADLNTPSMTGFLSTLATNITTFGIAGEMNKKGVMLNSAFAVSASFVLADHLAFTMATDPDYILPVILGKLISGISALALAIILFKKIGKPT